MFKRLLDSGSDIEQVFPDEHGGKTALLLCVAADWAEGITELFSRGVRNTSTCALQLALQLNHWAAVQALSRAGHGYHDPDGKTVTLMVQLTPAIKRSMIVVQSFLQTYLSVVVDSISPISSTKVTASFLCKCSQVKADAPLYRSNISIEGSQFDMMVIDTSAKPASQTTKPHKFRPVAVPSSTQSVNQ